MQFSRYMSSPTNKSQNPLLQSQCLGIWVIYVDKYDVDSPSPIKFPAAGRRDQHPLHESGAPKMKRRA